jgi:hypothetical protein
MKQPQSVKRAQNVPVVMLSELQADKSLKNCPSPIIHSAYIINHY